jgi:type I restriction enzyme, S subunit
MSELPPTWTQVQLAAITVDAPQRVPSAEEAIRYIDIGSVNRNSKSIESSQELLGKDAPSRARKQVAVGDTLVSMTRPNLNAVALVPKELDGQFASTGFDVLRPVAGIDPRWVSYLVRTESFVDAMSDLVKGALYPAVRSKDVRTHVVPLASQAEQKRIADQLDTLLARVSACNDRLDAIPTLLKRFRHAVLRAATSGELTASLRSERGWSGSWNSLELGELGELGRGKSKHRPRNDPRLYGGESPFIQTGDIAQSNGVITKHSQTYSEFGLQQSKLWPTGTICITIAANIADTAILSYPACFPDSVVGFIADEKKCINTFIKWSIDVIKSDLEAFAPATAQKNINLSILNDVVVRCPSLNEQVEIVRRVEDLFALADRIEVRCKAARAQVQRLSPQVLNKAFRGELVPQDPNDELVSALMVRIAADRTLSPANPKTTSSRKPRTRRATTATKETGTMIKSRHDDDVKGKPYLAEHLRRVGKTIAAEELFKIAELPIADFYKQLAWEVNAGLIKDQKTMLEATNAA